MTASPIGDSVRRRDAPDKLRGRTRFAIDRGEPGMLHVALRRAEVAAARLLRVDTAPALALEGVHAVVTEADAPGLYGVGVADHPLFARGVIRHHGEAIAAVAAETAEQARAAAAAIVVELEPLPAHLTMAEALAPGAREIHPDWRSYEELVAGGARAGNVAWEATAERGDVDAAFARSDVVIVEGTYATGRQNQASLEPRVALARYEDGRFTVETSTQYPWAVKAAIARQLGVSPAAVRITVPPVGGGFGQKFESSIEPVAAVLARQTGRPVRLALSREEEMRTALCRENAEIRIRSAVTADGEIAAREATVLLDCGAYGGEQTFLTSLVTHTLMGSYRLGAVRLRSRAVYTNTAPTGAFRACCGTYCTFALERHTDDICAAIGADRHAFRAGAVIGNGDVGPTGQVFEGDVLAPMLARMNELRERRPGPPADGRLYGTGVAVGTWFIFAGPSAATVRLNPDGGATLITAGVEIGSGSLVQALPQIVAERLGIAPGDVTVAAADTDAAGFDMGVGGGRTTVSLGAASRGAADEVRRKLLEHAADLLEAAPEDLLLADGEVRVAGAPASRRTIDEVVAHAHAVSGPLAGDGSFTGPGLRAAPGCAAGHMIEALDLPVFAVHECDVAVDPDTGHVEVLDYRVVQDVGRAINPRAIAEQIQGGVVQGLGYALHEEITFDEHGQVRQGGWESYRLPLASDALPVRIALHEGAPSVGPHGAKGAGEVPILNVAAAVGCAITDAIDRPMTRLPMTPVRVLATILGHEQPPALPHISTGGGR
ncbi:MAG TPA: xanthine dehydrogenase family protein molybdopterin-binding subunit [Solirubrobacteraceae bacterium]|nr:xanthine dehydrogenase family protein molybdopterin-binding subunit [Solirubrobacteraceae bacterium]